MNIIEYLKAKIYLISQLGRNIWLLFAVGLILNIIIWLIWYFKVQYNIIASVFASGILLVNCLLSLIFIKKDEILLYFLASIAIFVQVLFLILLYFTVLNP